MTAAAVSNRQRKAKAIAPFLHRRCLTVADVLAMPRSSKEAGDRKAPTQNGLARAAYAEAGVVESEPHGPGSETWRLTGALLEWMAGHPDDERVPAVDRLDDRSTWIPEAPPCQTPTSIPPPVPAAADTTSTSTTSTDAAAAEARQSSADSPSPPAPTAPAAGREPWRTAGFPRADGAACTGCGTWHRRYGPQGHGALCDDCNPLRTLEHQTA